MSFTNLLNMFLEINSLENRELKAQLENSLTSDVFIDLSRLAGYDFNKDELDLLLFWVKENNMNINDIRSLSRIDEMDLRKVMRCPTGEDLAKLCKKNPNHQCCTSTLDKILDEVKIPSEELDFSRLHHELWLEDKRIINSLWNNE